MSPYRSADAPCVAADVEDYSTRLIWEGRLRPDLPAPTTTWRSGTSLPAEYTRIRVVRHTTQDRDTVITTNEVEIMTTCGLLGEACWTPVHPAWMATALAALAAAFGERAFAG